MAKKKPVQQDKIMRTVINELRTMTDNVAMTRAMMVRSLIETVGNHDIYKECGYPTEISAEDYKKMYERQGIATRVVSIYPSESWTVQPWVFETQKLEDEEQTEFETAWTDLYEKLGLYEKLNRLDEVSGIGHYGVLLLGFNDGRDLKEPVQGIMGKSGKPSKKGPASDAELLYVMPFDEASAPIKKFDTDQSSPRYGLPVSYNIQISDPKTSPLGGAPVDAKQVEVHWTRVIHVADNCKSSEVYGTPRMRTVFNRLVDIEKILGSSAEMFWKGGFPGISFEVPPDVSGSGQVQLSPEDKAELKEEIEKYMSSLKRYLSLVGVTAKQLSVEIADKPMDHLNVQILAICIAIEVPQRVFSGTEEAKLASVQDAVAWNKRVQRRQNLHVTPKIIRPLIERLQLTGVLPQTEKFFVEWPDIYSISDLDRAESAAKMVTAIAQYVTSEAKTFIPPLQFLTWVWDFDPAEAKEILDAAEEYVADQVKKGLMLDPKEQNNMQK